MCIISNGNRIKSFVKEVKSSILITIVILLSINISFAALNENYVASSNDLPEWIVNSSTPPDFSPVTENEKWEILSRSRANNYPSRVDHTHSKYMPPVLYQAGGSCYHASLIYYNLCYSLNAYRKDSVAGQEQMLPTHFTYWISTIPTNFVGIPNVKVYGGRTISKIYGGGSKFGWMQGYSSWKNAMFNRTTTRKQIDITGKDNLTLIKEWVNNRYGDTSFAEGGVISIAYATSAFKRVKIPDSLYEGGKIILVPKDTGTKVDHEVTLTGYDDSVGYDFNGDGKITNDIDINGDSIVDLKDRERGAFIFLNSWGKAWANQGWVYLPYRSVVLGGKYVSKWGILQIIKKDYRPKVTIKVKMDYSERKNLKIGIGFSKDSTAKVPDYIAISPHFDFKGKEKIPMLGFWKKDSVMHTEPMEFGIDLGNLSKQMLGFDTRKGHRYFLTIETKDSSAGIGTVYDVSVIKYRYKGQGVKADYDSVVIKSAESNVKIPAGKQKIYIPITIPGDSLDVPKYVFVPHTETSIEYVGGEEKTAKNIIDDNLKTKWVLGKGAPQEIVIKLDKEYAVSGLEYYTRSDGGCYGQVKDYEIYLSTDGVTWGDPIAIGKWSRSFKPQRNLFAPTKSKYFKFKALSIYDNRKYVSMREIKIIYTPDNTTGISENSLQHSTKTLVNTVQNKNSIIFNLNSNMRKVGLCKIYNIQGKLVKTISPKSLYGKVSYTVNKNEFSKQVYIVKIKLENSSFVQKIF